MNFQFVISHPLDQVPRDQFAFRAMETDLPSRAVLATCSLLRGARTRTQSRDKAARSPGEPQRGRMHLPEDNASSSAVSCQTHAPCWALVQSLQNNLKSVQNTRVCRLLLYKGSRDGVCDTRSTLRPACMELCRVPAPKAWCTSPAPAQRRRRGAHRPQ